VIESLTFSKAKLTWLQVLEALCTAVEQRQAVTSDKALRIDLQASFPAFCGRFSGDALLTAPGRLALPTE
jgi:hypothetical protein